MITKTFGITQMTLISVSDYRHACAKYIREALQRPRMYYRSLNELEAMMSGHYVAYEQLGGIEKHQSFRKEFIAWLWESKGMSGSAGWAYAIQALASSEQKNEEELFSRLINEFFDHWLQEK